MTPASSASMVANSSASRSMRSDSLRRSCRRLVPGVERQIVNAVFAAETAVSMSLGEAEEMVARSSPVAGLVVSRVLPVREGTNSLLMKRPVGTF